MVRNPMRGSSGAGRYSGEKPRNMWQTLRRLLRYWTPYRWTMAWMTLCALVSVGTSVMGPWLIGRTIDEGFVVEGGISVDYSSLLRNLVLLMVVYVVGLLCDYAQEWSMAGVSQGVVSNMRTELFNHLLTLDLRFFDGRERGDLLSRVTNDTELIKEGLGRALIQAVTTVVQMVAMVVVMLSLSWRLTLVVSVSIPVVVVLSRVVIARSRRWFSAQQRSLGQMNSAIEESISGLRTIRSLGREDTFAARFAVGNEGVREAGTQAQINSGLLMPLLRVLDNLSYILVAVVGGLMAMSGAMTVGLIQSFLLYTRHFLRPVNQIATQLNTLQSAVAGAERIFGILDERGSIETTATSLLPQEDVRGRVEFDRVEFGYVPGTPILKGVSFVAEPGQVVAIVGTTGAGKTTLMNLLVRFYDVDAGAIRIDGVDIRQYDLTYLRDSMAFVLQEPILFSGTVSYNIRYGDPALSDMTAVRASARQARADAFIERMPGGYEARLIRQGENLSNGQRQLLTIARAIHSHAPMLVLDEATSNIDSHNEALLQEAIRNLAAGRTCFMIAHRLSTIRNADVILVLRNGQIVERGTHEELLALGGEYKRIHDSGL